MPDEAPNRRLAQQTILVVDDEPAIAEVVARVARSNGLSVQVTTSVDGALRLAGSQSFDLIISDVQMPGARGPELLRRLHELGISAPVIFISGELSLSTVDESLRTPRALFLPKPFTPQELMQAIWAALAQK